MASSRFHRWGSFGVGQIPVGDRGDGDVAHVDLLLEDQVGEQAERPREHRQLDGESPGVLDEPAPSPLIVSAPRGTRSSWRNHETHLPGAEPVTTRARVPVRRSVAEPFDAGMIARPPPRTPQARSARRAAQRGN